MVFSVEIKPLDEIVYVEEGQTILDAALRAGLNLPHSCGHGLCSNCKVNVLEGEVEYGDTSPFALMDFEKNEGKCLTCCASPLSNLVIESSIEDDVDAIHYRVKDFKAVVTKVENLSENVKGVFLLLLEEDISFQAGQYVNVKIPGLKGQDRAFSIASPSSVHNFIELNVALIEGGEGTRYFHNNVKVGDVLSLSGPRGNFFVRRSLPGPVIFMASGSGLSSAKSMIMDLLENHDRRPITLFYEASTPSELYYHELFMQLDKDNKNFLYVPTVLAVDKHQPWDGRTGSVNESIATYLNNQYEGYTVYISGLPEMIDACVTTLIKGRCFEKNIFVENFYSNANRNDSHRGPLFKKI